jgi:hypothetical protein
MTKQQEIVMIIVNKRTNVLNKKRKKKTNKHVCCLPMGTKKKNKCQDDISKMQERGEEIYIYIKQLLGQCSNRAI